MSDIWIPTHSGAGFDFIDLRENRYNVGDIAIGLARAHRWNGQTHDPINVADHTIMLADNLRQQHDSTLKRSHNATPGELARLHREHRWTMLYAVLHDAPEAYTGDLTTPFKINLKFCGRDLREYERYVLRSILHEFAPGYVDDILDHYSFVIERVKQADERCMATEYRDQIHQSDRFTPELDPYDNPIDPLILATRNSERALTHLIQTTIEDYHDHPPLGATKIPR